METEITDIGKVAITPRKDYKNEQAYEWLDVVTYNGASYMCIAEDGCTGIVPTNTDYWQLLADKGHFTEEDKEEFKKAVVEESKTEINEHTGNKKTELNNYTTELEKSLENELDTYKTEKETQMDSHKATLETEMANKKDSLIEEIETAQNGFDANVEEKTNTFNSNVETKTTEFNNNSNAKTEEFNNNSTEKINAFNSNAEEKIADYNAHVETLTSRIADLEEENSELVEQMPWNTTEIQESIHVEDAARYSKNKLNVLGNLTQTTREGINLINTSEQLNNTVNGITKINNKDGSLTLKGTATAETKIQLRIGTLAEGKYTYKCFGNQTDCVTSIYYVGNVTKENIRVFTVSADSTNNYVFMYIIAKDVTINVTIKPMLVKGEYTSDTFPNFEQYGAMPSIEYPSTPIVATGVQTIRKCKKNLIPQPYNESVISHYGVSFSVNPDYSISINGTSTNTACDFYLFGTRADLGNYLYFKKGVYALKNFEKENVLYIAREKTLGALFGSSSIINALKKQNCYFYSLIVRIELNKTVNTTIYPQLEIGDTATEYEPYSEETFALDLEDKELALIKDSNGNVVARDRFILKDNKWRIERNIATHIVDKTTFLQTTTSSEGKYRYQYFQIKDSVVTAKNKKSGICNIFSLCNDGQTYNCQKGFTMTTSVLNCYNEGETLEEFLAKLEGIDIVVTYILREPTYEDCTESQCEVLDKLHKLSLAQGTNNIFVESENGVTTELQLEYMQDNNLKKAQENKALEDRITAIENLLSTTETSALLLDNMQNDLESEVK